MGSDDELVLVDDGSTDAGPTAAKRWVSTDPRVTLVTTAGTERTGIVAALDLGLERCNGAFIARMDADDESLPGRFAAQRAMLDDNPALGAVASKIELFGAPGPGMERYATWQNGILTPAEHARAIFVEAPICHPSTMLRRAALDAVGGFRAGPFAEDYDLWLRLVAAGWEIAKVPTVLFRWRIHPNSTTWTDPRFTEDAHRALRAEHLARKLDRPFALWGAGQCGRRLARALEAHGPRPAYFIDIDPKKIGRTTRGRPIVSMEAGVAEARERNLLIIAAVAAPGARDLVRAHLDAHGFREGVDYFCAA
jgi:glycosyltransferase involved in cell wall biosynthesis